ncbi:hypothetical protein niasHT_003688 [Heterodera trifolii]|uniref:OTU domain-containing protein n=1 Tax=Heterodera trifolii TaxID=157864 RepID=A0ABD2M907_9BILA
MRARYINLESPEEVYVLVARGDDKRILRTFKNYDELEQTMAANWSKLWNQNRVEFDQLKGINAKNQTKDIRPKAKADKEKSENLMPEFEKAFSPKKIRKQKKNSNHEQVMIERDKTKNFPKNNATKKNKNGPLTKDKAKKAQSDQKEQSTTKTKSSSSDSESLSGSERSVSSTQSDHLNKQAKDGQKKIKNEKKVTSPDETKNAKSPIIKKKTAKEKGKKKNMQNSDDESGNEKDIKKLPNREEEMNKKEKATKKEETHKNEMAKEETMNKKEMSNNEKETNKKEKANEKEKIDKNEVMDKKEKVKEEMEKKEKTHKDKENEKKEIAKVGMDKEEKSNNEKEMKKKEMANKKEETHKKEMANKKEETHKNEMAKEEIEKKEMSNNEKEMKKNEKAIKKEETHKKEMAEKKDAGNGKKEMAKAEMEKKESMKMNKEKEMDKKEMTKEETEKKEIVNEKHKLNMHSDPMEVPEFTKMTTIQERHINGKQEAKKQKADQDNNRPDANANTEYDTYTFTPIGQYAIIVAIGPYDGPKQTKFLTNAYGQIEWNFFKHIHNDEVIHDIHSHYNAQEKITILVEKAPDKRIMTEYVNYDEMHKAMELSYGKLCERNYIDFTALPVALPDLPVEVTDTLLSSVKKNLKKMNIHKYTFDPAGQYEIIVALGPYDNSNCFAFFTDKKGNLKWNFKKNIHNNRLIRERYINDNLHEKITILVKKWSDKRIMSEFLNYADMTKTMEDTKGQLCNYERINFNKLPVAPFDSSSPEKMKKKFVEVEQKQNNLHEQLILKQADIEEKLEEQNEQQPIEQSPVETQTHNEQTAEPKSFGLPVPVDVKDLIPTPQIESSIDESATSPNHKEPTLKPRYHKVIGDGDCFYRAICYSIFQVDESENSDALRVAASKAIEKIVNNKNIFPRKIYDTHAEFINELELALLEPSSAKDYDQSLSAYAKHIVKPARNGHGQWAQIDDARIVSIVLRRPVVIMHPHPLPGRNVLAELRPKYDDSSIERRVVVYFPDGEIMEKKGIIDAEELCSFTIKCDSCQDNQMKCPRCQEKVLEKVVENPIVIWYNGLDHYDSIVFDPRTPNASAGAEYIKEPIAKCTIIPKGEYKIIFAIGHYGR